jgi:hypothetical protein
VRGHLLGISLPRLAPDLHLRAREACLANDVHVYTKGGTVNGHGNYVTIAPALNMPDIMLEDGMARIAKALNDLLAQHQGETIDDN